MESLISLFVRAFTVRLGKMTAIRASQRFSGLFALVGIILFVIGLIAAAGIWGTPWISSLPSWLKLSGLL